MKVGITGASGHLGYATYLQLKQLDIEQRLLLRNEVSHIKHSDIVLGDLENDTALYSLTNGCDVIIHIAGIVWPSKLKNNKVVQVNYNCTKQLFEIAKKQGVQHFIYISSIHSMVDSEEEVFDESTPICINSNYSYNYSKAAAEKFLNEKSDVKVTILNPTAVIGPYDFYFNGMNQLFQKIEQKKLPMVVEGGYNIVDVRDVATAIKNAALNKIEGKFILGGNYVSMLDLVSAYGEENKMKVTSKVLKSNWMKLLAKMSAPIEFIRKKPISLNTYAVETLLTGHKNISSTKAKKQLGFSNRPLKDSLRDIHVWLNKKENI